MKVTGFWSVVSESNYTVICDMDTLSKDKCSPLERMKDLLKGISMHRAIFPQLASCLTNF